MKDGADHVSCVRTPRVNRGRLGDADAAMFYHDNNRHRVRQGRANSIQPCSDVASARVNERLKCLSD